MPRVGDVVRKDQITCQLTDSIGNVAAKVQATGDDHCVVVADGNVVLGRVRGKALEGDSDLLVEEVMESGPTTFRTNEMLESVMGRMSTRNVDRVLVTTSDGRLVGTLYRTDAEARLAQEEDLSEMEESSCNCSA